MADFPTSFFWSLPKGFSILCEGADNDLPLSPFFSIFMFLSCPTSSSPLIPRPPPLRFYEKASFPLFSSFSPSTHFSTYDNLLLCPVLESVW